MKKINFLFVAIILFFVALLIFVIIQNKNEFSKKILIGNAEIFVEIADSQSEWEKGLMFREFLQENSGMLFVFPDSQERSFWMKNTLIDLDIIFIDENFKIKNIQTAVPCEKEPCKKYESLFPVKYVLEVNSGFAEKHNIRIGDKIQFKF